jgi:hypothetical protein
MEFESFYNNFGLITYPFSIYSTEGEIDKAKDIFIKPTNHSIIVENLKDTSVIVIGERGTGKTALNLDVAGYFSDVETIFVKIEDFSALDINYSSEDLYRLLTEKIASTFFKLSAKDPSELWSFSKEERIWLSFYLYNYLKPASKQMIRDKINKLQNNFLKRAGIKAYNFSRVVLNYGLKAATKAASDALTKHFASLPPLDLNSDYDYFPRLENEIDTTFDKSEKEFYYLCKICKLVLKTRFRMILLVIDKIDEDSRLENDAEKVSDFIKQMVADNKLLLNDNFHILLFLWNTPFNYVRGNVRTQKLVCQTLTWDRTLLEKALCKRLSVFSDGKVADYKDLFESDCEAILSEIFLMCNENPRDLWHLFDRCFQEQYKNDPSKSKISKIAATSAIREFVVKFNYYEYYPKKSNARRDSLDIYSYIKHLQKLGSPEFTKNQLNTLAGTGGSTNNYVVSMENIGLIKRLPSKAAGGAILYRVKDPKVVYAMENQIEIEK